MSEILSFYSGWQNAKRFEGKSDVISNYKKSAKSSQLLSKI